nr:NAD(P)H-binding protein [Weissella coleopterorum]
MGLARNITKAKAIVPENVIIKKGDFNEHITMRASLKGVDKLLFISSQPGQAVSRSTQHLNVVRAAQEAGVKFIAYTSFPHADTATTPLAVDHQITEKALQATHIPTSFLRNNWYLENETATLKTALEQKIFIDATDGQPAGWALEAEYAQAAANVLTLTHPQPVYELSGPAQTYPELLGYMPASIAVKSVAFPQLKVELAAAKYPNDQVAAITFNQQIIADGQLSQTSNDLPKLLGHALMNPHDALQQVLK